ncbi:hypothetical protein ACOSP7_022307 [Xanthoceras sorbifolium]
MNNFKIKFLIKKQKSNELTGQRFAVQTISCAIVLQHWCLLSSARVPLLVKLGRGRYGGRGGPRLFCQLCGKSGHVVATCYHRFDQNFRGINQQQQ